MVEPRSMFHDYRTMLIDSIITQADIKSHNYTQRNEKKKR